MCKQNIIIHLICGLRTIMGTERPSQTVFCLINRILIKLFTNRITQITNCPIEYAVNQQQSISIRKIFFGFINRIIRLGKGFTNLATQLTNATHFLSLNAFVNCFLLVTPLVN